MLHACSHLHGQGKTTFGQQIVEGSIGYLRNLKRKIQAEERARARPGELMAMLPRLLCSINLYLNIDALGGPPPATNETSKECLARSCSIVYPMTSKCRSAICVVDILGEHCTGRTFQKSSGWPSCHTSGHSCMLRLAFTVDI